MSRGIRGQGGSVARELVDAVVIGAGPNGLVAANLLVDAGWSVLVLEAAARAGRRGAQRGGDRARLHQRPLQLVLPARAGLADHRRAAAWTSTGCAGGTPRRCWRTRCRTAGPRCSAATSPPPRPASRRAGAGDGEAWERMFAEWQRLSPALVPALFRPLPPVRPAAGLLRRLGPAGALRFARFAVLPVRRFGAEEFTGGRGHAAAGRQRDAHRPVAGVGRQRAVRLAAGDARPGRRLPDAGGRRRAAHRRAGVPAAGRRAAGWSATRRSPGSRSGTAARSGSGSAATAAARPSACAGPCWPT